MRAQRQTSAPLSFMTWAEGQPEEEVACTCPAEAAENYGEDVYPWAVGEQKATIFVQVPGADLPREYIVERQWYCVALAAEGTNPLRIDGEPDDMLADEPPQKPRLVKPGDY